MRTMSQEKFDEKLTARVNAIAAEVARLEDLLVSRVDLLPREAEAAIFSFLAAQQGRLKALIDAERNPKPAARPADVFVLPTATIANDLAPAPVVAAVHATGSPAHVQPPAIIAGGIIAPTAAIATVGSLTVNATLPSAPVANDRTSGAADEDLDSVIADLAGLG